MATEGSILYLLSADRLWLDSRLEEAQADAIKRQLPLAAVVCVKPEHYTEKLPQLQHIEMQLEKHGLPLIVLIGTEAATLPSLVKHARPAYVYGHGSETIGRPVKLARHPYAWPGVVIKTGELKQIVDKNTFMC